MSEEKRRAREGRRTEFRKASSAVDEVNDSFIDTFEKTYLSMTTAGVCEAILDREVGVDCSSDGGCG